ncbi:hypothetical protein WDZ92_52230, partial [Nostoc sp. NIES-2111]
PGWHRLVRCGRQGLRPEAGRLIMSAERLIARLREQRDSWLVLREAGDGVTEQAVCLRRPAEAEMPSYRPSGGETMHQVLTSAVCRVAVNWRGITEADLLGAAVGSSDLVEFSQELWAEVVRDRSDWLSKCADHLMEQIHSHLSAKALQRKN